MQMSAVQLVKLWAAFSPDKLVKHSADLVKKLKDSDADVRQAACRALGNLSSKELAECSSQLLKMLEDPDAWVRSAACDALGGLSSIQLAKHSSELVKNLAEKKLDLESSSAIFRVPIQSAPSRDTWLHIAAKHGSFEVCRAVLHGRFAAPAQRNYHKKTASDVAAAHGHKELAEELKPKVLETRGGTGAAFAKAWDCKDMVTEVSWWMLPLPGVVGSCFGTVHSMLKIRAGEKSFLIEGAFPEQVKRYGETTEEIKQAAKNGLFVSEWSDVENADNLRDLHGKQLWGDHLGNAITTRDLIRHLLRKGLYNTGRNNCHHTAFHGYNFCAATKEQLRSLPVNYAQTKLAWGLSLVGIDLAGSRSCGQAIPLASPLYTGISRDKNFTGDVPPTWIGETHDGFVDVARHSDEWLGIETSLRENGGAEIPDFHIERIQRNQNLEMLKDFRTEFRKVHGQRQLQLLHAPGAAHDLVAERGFAKAYANMNFNAYGAGFYFAQDLRLPDFFATGRENHPGPSEARLVLLCCVAAGKSAIKQRIFPFVPGDPKSGRPVGEWQAELAKPENRKAPDGCQSCISDTNDELIVYEANQIYVEYSIRYTSSAFAGNPYDNLRGSLKEIPQET